MAWILLLVGGTLLCRLAVMQFAAHMDDRTVQSAWRSNRNASQGDGALLEALSAADREMLDKVRATKAQALTVSNASKAVNAPKSIAPKSGDRPAAVEPAGKWSGWRTMTVVKTFDESPDCRSFYFEPTDEFPLPEFLGGQYILIGLKDPDSGKTVSRCYSLSDAFNAERYRITVKRVPDGKVSNLLHDTVRVGDEVQLRAPSGRFHLDVPETQKPLILVAAGIGITPMVSMLRHARRVTPDRPIRLFYQLRSSLNAPFLSELRELAMGDGRTGKFRLYVAFSRPGEGEINPQDATGRISANSILQTCQSPVGSFRICGPQSFMTNIAAGLVEGGVEEPDVQYESFGGGTKGVGAIAIKPASEADASPVQVEADSTSSDDAVSNLPEVTFAQSDQVAKWSDEDESLLETAERVGVDVASACRSGQCGSCALRLIRGAVKYQEEPEFPVEGDEVLMCVAKPCGPVSVDA